MNVKKLANIALIFLSFVSFFQTLVNQPLFPQHCISPLWTPLPLTFSGGNRPVFYVDTLPYTFSWGNRPVFSCEHPFPVLSLGEQTCIFLWTPLSHTFPRGNRPVFSCEHPFPVLSLGETYLYFPEPLLLGFDLLVLQFFPQVLERLVHLTEQVIHGSLHLLRRHVGRLNHQSKELTIK